jgi:hypothetical protein
MAAVRSVAPPSAPWVTAVAACGLRGRQSPLRSRGGGPAGRDTPEPFVDAEDIADVVVAALTDDRHIGELCELTGPRLLTFTDAVAEIAKATTRNIRYQPVSIDEHAATARGQGLTAEVIDLLTYLFSEVLDGRNAKVTDGVERALAHQLASLPFDQLRLVEAEAQGPGPGTYVVRFGGRGARFGNMRGSRRDP